MSAVYFIVRCIIGGVIGYFTAKFLNARIERREAKAALKPAA